MGNSTIHTFLGVFTVVTIFLFGFKNSQKVKEPVKLPKVISSNFNYIPSGNLRYDEQNKHIHEFYMSTTEVSNSHYAEFLNYLQKTEDLKTLKLAKIDSTNWSKSLNYSQSAYTEFYHKHPAYGLYPVVNITAEGAEAYCRYLTEIYNRIDPTFEYTIEVRLPTRDEWLRAAQANSNKAVYTWGGPYLRNSKGQALCNYKQLGDESISFDEEANDYKVLKTPRYLGVAGKLNNNADITAPVFSYWPNDFGLYNMNGNVAELVLDGVACGGSWKSTGYDVRNLSMIRYEGASNEIGFRPVFVLHKKEI